MNYLLSYRSKGKKESFRPDNTKQTPNGLHKTRTSVERKAKHLEDEGLETKIIKL